MRSRCFKRIEKIKWDLFKGICFPVYDTVLCVANNGTSSPKPLVIWQGYWKNKKLARAYK